MMTAPSTSRRGVFAATVALNQPLCRDHYRVLLDVAGLPPSRPGQFVQLGCRRLAPQTTLHEVTWSPGQPPRLTQPELTNREPMLRRPLSIGGRRELGGGISRVEIIYRAVGAGTRWLSTAPKGTELDFIGPLGNGFVIRPEKPLAALIGGGVGIPPMIYLAEALAAAGRRTVAFAGVRSAEMLPLELACQPAATAAPSQCVREFAQYGIASVVATDDRSLGAAGPVSETFRQWLNTHLPAGDELVVYSCGPEPMMRAVAEICLSRGYECQLALERHMACGMGTCQSCVVKIRTHDQPQDGAAGAPGKGWAFKLCCTDGPVFDARDILW
jgi:dihydroorotate dehydrogenase electron transfer subunit